LPLLQSLGEDRRFDMFTFSHGMLTLWLANGIKWYHRFANGI